MATPGRSPAIWSNPHDIIELSILVKADLFAELASRYEAGLSLREIAEETGIPKSSVRSELVRRGVTLREKTSASSPKVWRKTGKRNTKPPYGFCYFEGRIVRHPKEYPVLRQIHQQWKSGRNANSIAAWLNGKRCPSPMGKQWSWNSVVNILNRFKNGTISIKGGRYELR